MKQVLSFLNAWINIYLAPRQSFSVIKSEPEKHKVWLPLLLLLAASLTTGLLTADLTKDYQRELLMNSDKYSSEQKEEIAKRFEAPVNPAMIAMPVIGWSLISIAALAGIYLFVGNFFGGGQIRYWTMASIIAYVSLIDVLAAAIKTPLMLIQQNALIDTSLALIFPVRDLGNIWYQAAMQFDLFLVWKLILLIIAFQTFFGFSRKKSIALVLPVWLSFRLIAFLMLQLSS
ncbi:MAG TPA: hypothetical protein ENN84_00545 [Candidatus Marinimicrobia bacterium]|nr:hypothetical protein [Candidatus Neomarinimicrobiota bacterium]